MKTILKVLGGVFVFGGIIAGTFLVQKNQDFREKASTPVSLSVVSDNKTVKKGQKFHLKVYLDSEDKKVKNLDLEISFDPSVFSGEEITLGPQIASIMQVLENNIDNINGKVYFRGTQKDISKYLTGSGLSILNITFQVKSTKSLGRHSISLVSKNDIVTTEGQDNTEVILTPEEIEVIETPEDATTLKRGDVNKDQKVDIVDIGIVTDNYYANPLQIH